MIPRKLLNVALVIVACGSATRAMAGDSPLALFSSDADVVIRLKGPQQTVEKAAATAAAVNPVYGDLIRDNKTFLGITISNPTLAGVDQKRDWYVAVFAHEDSDPEVLFAVPTNNADEFDGALSKKLSRFADDGWLFYSEKSAAVDRIKAGKPAAEASIVSEIGEGARKVFEAGDVSVFINADHLMQVYRKQFEAAGKELANRWALVPGAPGLPTGELFADGFDEVQAFLEDSQSVTIALVFNPTGINFETYMDFRPDSEMARRLDAHTGNKLASVAQLPTDSLVYIGLDGSLFGMVEQLANAAAAAPGTDPDVQAKLKSLQKSMKDVNYRSVAFDFNLGDTESGLIRTVGIIEAAPTAKIREFARESTGLLNVKSNESGIEVDAEYAEEAETVGGHKVDLQTVQFSVDPNNPFGGFIEPMMTALFGPDGQQTRYVFWDDKYVQAIGGGTEALAASLKRIDQGQSNATPEHRRELLETADVLVLADVQRLLRSILKGLDSSPNFPFPIDEKLISGDDPAASYIGFTLSTEADAVHTKLQLPGTQIQAIVKFAMFARTLSQSLQGR